MKQALIVSVSRVVKIVPKLVTKAEEYCFLDVEEGRAWVEANKDKVLNVFLAKIID